MSEILVVNSGSSSIKFALFDESLDQIIAGAASEIGGEHSGLKVGPESQTLPLGDHHVALDAILGALESRGYHVQTLSAAAHRVVHGGRDLIAPMRITDQVLGQIEACIPLAPLHNPHNLAAIVALRGLSPELPQFASFDTAFHATNPEVALRYAIPAEEDARGLRRYGFHGTSYASLVESLPDISGRTLPGRLLACHLGNGASLCAILDGRSVATTMGFSPLEGLTMGTRAGNVDPNAVLRMAEEFGVERAGRVLNHESGLLGLSGSNSDMRALESASTPDAAFAVEHFCYWALRHAGSMIAAMGGLDAIAFTGGIGENSDQVRARIMGGLDWLGLSFERGANRSNQPRLHNDSSRVQAWIVPAREERMIAAQALTLMKEAR